MAPGQDVAAVRMDGESRRLAMLRWGLVPGWARDPKAGPRPINARAETARTKPAFRDAFASRRCLVPADGFYEWARDGAGKRPWLIRMKDGGPFAFAGLWERWPVRGHGPDALETFAILTTAANEVLAPIHHRMPVILKAAAFGPWLTGEEVPLGPCPPEAMTAWPVSTFVNRPANDGPRCIEPLDPAAGG